MDYITWFVFLSVFSYGIFFKKIYGGMLWLKMKFCFLIVKKFEEISEANANLIAIIIILTPLLLLYFMMPFLPLLLDLSHFKDIKERFIFGLCFALGVSSSIN